MTDVFVKPTQDGGLSIFRSLDIDETEEDVKTAAGQIYAIHAMNLKASVLYLKFFNAAAADVTVGTTTPVMTFALPTQGDTNGSGFCLNLTQGVAFDTAISVACVTGVADNDTTGAGANECIVHVFYK